MTEKWNKFTIVHIVLEALIAITGITFGIIFERNRAGILFTNSQQERFSHLVLSYGCLTLVCPTVLSGIVLSTFSGFSLLAAGEILLAILSLVSGSFMIQDPLSVLQHGLIEIHIGTTVSGTTEKVVLSNKIIPLLVGALLIVQGIWLVIHAVSTLIKQHKVKPTWIDIKMRAIATTVVATANTTRSRRRNRNRIEQGHNNPNPDQRNRNEANPAPAYIPPESVSNRISNNNSLQFAGSINGSPHPTGGAWGEQSGDALESGRNQGHNRPGPGRQFDEGSEFDLDVDSDEACDTIEDPDCVFQMGKFGKKKKNDDETEISIKSTTRGCIIPLAHTPSMAQEERF